MSLTIVVGTSRCGSTMLSRMLGMHPQVLSISEFWNCFMDTEGSIPAHDMNGEEFWQRLTTPASSYDGLVSAGIKPDEHLAPYSSRFDFADDVPPLSRVLGWSTGKSPDPLYDELAPVVSARPRRSTAEHCRALFADLAARLGRGVIVERTGGSLAFPIPLAFFGWLWSDFTRTGTREIRRVQRDRMMTLRYEPLLNETRAELVKLAAFIGARADQQWLDRTCAYVDSGRSGSAAAQVHPGELATLRAVCAVGARAFDVLEAELTV